MSANRTYKDSVFSRYLSNPKRCTFFACLREEGIVVQEKYMENFCSYSMEASFFGNGGWHSEGIVKILYPENI